MADVLIWKPVATRIEHRCETCCLKYPKGSVMTFNKVVDGGTFWKGYFCETCTDIIKEFREHTYNDDGYIEENIVHEHMKELKLDSPQQVLEYFRNNKTTNQ